MKINKFSEFATEKPQLEGEKLKIDDILNIELIATGFRINNSKFKESKYLQLQIDLNGKKHIIFTGSEVLIDQITRYEDQLPFSTTIIKIKKYYTFT